VPDTMYISINHVKIIDANCNIPVLSYTYILQQTFTYIDNRVMIYIDIVNTLIKLII